jgi:hypothetical protein
MDREPNTAKPSADATQAKPAVYTGMRQQLETRVCPFCGETENDTRSRIDPSPGGRPRSLNPRVLHR